MIVNRNVIHGEILKQTLRQQISRLNNLCSNRNLYLLQQKIISLENNIQYSAYTHNQKITSHRCQKEHHAKVYAETLNEKKMKDLHQKQNIEDNRNLLSNLQKIKRQLIEQSKKNREAEFKSIDLAKQQENLQSKYNEFIGKVEEQQTWIKRLKIAQQLCKREIASQKENIKYIIEQIKVKSHTNLTISQSNQQIKQQIDQIKFVNNRNFNQIQKKKVILEQQEKQILKQYEQLNHQKQCKITMLNEYQRKNNQQSQLISQINIKLNINESTRSQLEEKIVKNMKLTEQVTNQLFAIKLNQTNQNIKTKESIDKIQRLKILKGSLIDLIY